MTDRALPANPETERALLGGLLLRSDAMVDVSDRVAGVDFARPAHRTLYELMGELHRLAGGFDIVTVTDALSRRAMEDAVGGISYVLALTSSCPSVANIELHADRVRDYAIRRRLQLAAERIIERVQNGATETPELLDGAEADVFAVSQGGEAAKSWVSMDRATVEHEVVIDDRARHPGALTGVTTGFVDMDQKLTGWQPTDLVVLAARPAMGKTALALNFAASAARTGVGVAIFSMEMGRGQLTERMLCADGRVDAHHVRTGQLSTDERRDLRHAADRVSRLPILIDDSSGLTISAIRSKARRAKTQMPSLGLIIVDYLQLMSGEGGGRENRESAISTISRGLKVLARDLEVPVIALSQLNRQVESRAEKKPMMSDLRESGAIEQDADVILFIYRDEVYNPESPDRGMAEVNVAKQRAGETGIVRLAFSGRHQLFTDLARGGDRWSQERE